jgi:putative alpha-1,2-mannosidase
MDSLYTTGPDGYPGNEDCGQMSAWFVMSSLGFYPVNPANGVYAIGTPLYKKSEINLESGKIFTIEAKNVSGSNFYIQSATLNGKPYSKSYITYQTITEGGELIFEMGDTPNKEWANGEDAIPPSGM